MNADLAPIGRDGVLRVLCGNGLRASLPRARRDRDGLPWLSRLVRELPSKT